MFCIHTREAKQKLKDLLGIPILLPAKAVGLHMYDKQELCQDRVVRNLVQWDVQKRLHS